MTKPTVFISYSHKDEEWKDRLVSHLVLFYCVLVSNKIGVINGI